MTSKPVVMTHLNVTLDAYMILARAVHEGVAHGLVKAHKHTSAPSREQAQEAVEREVMQALADVLKF